MADNRKDDNEDLSGLVRAGAEDFDDLDDGDATADRGDELTPPSTEPPAKDPDPATEPPKDAEPEPEPQSKESPPAEPEAGEPESESDADKDGDRSKEPRIPKSRFDEINQRRKQAEARLAEIEAQKKAADEAEQFDFDAKEKEYMDAVTDGDHDKALSIRREIRSAEQSLYEQRVQQASRRTSEQTQAQLELKTTVNELMQEYPVFDAESDQFNNELTDEALELFEYYKGRSDFTPALAVRKAVDLVTRANGVGKAGAEPAAEPAKPESPPAQDKPTAQQVEKKLKDAASQPPEPTGQPADGDIDIMSIDEEEFEKLSEQELRKHRGDML